MSDNIIIKNDNKPYEFNDFSIVKYCQYGKHLDIKEIERKSNSISKYRKLDKSKGVNTETGEVVLFNKTEKRIDSMGSLKKSANELYKLIHYNFYDNKGLHVVLTYNEPIVCSSELYRDFKIFWQKFKYRYQDWGYISIVEPMKNGRWHIHLLLKNQNNSFSFISRYNLRNMWNKGIVSVCRLHQYVDYGQYFRRKITENGHLLNLYEAGMRYYRHSRNIKKPPIFEDRYFNIKYVIEQGEYELSNEYNLTVNIIDEVGEKKLVNRIHYKYYNKNF